MRRGGWLVVCALGCSFDATGTGQTEGAGATTSTSTGGRGHTGPSLAQVPAGFLDDYADDQIEVAPVQTVLGDCPQPEGPNNGSGLLHGRHGLLYVR